MLRTSSKSHSEKFEIGFELGLFLRSHRERQEHGDVVKWLIGEW